jgi:hypothetical protein
MFNIFSSVAQELIFSIKKLFRDQKQKKITKRKENLLTISLALV